MSPQLTVVLQSGSLAVHCNEVGFSAADVAAVSDIGASSKRGNERCIGRKGLGFKAVFALVRGGVEPTLLATPQPCATAPTHRALSAERESSSQPSRRPTAWREKAPVR